MAQQPLHWIVEARGPDVVDGPLAQLEGTQVATLVVPDSSRGRALSVTFDSVADALIRIPEVYWEPDGSFAWTIPDKNHPSQPRYRLQGQLADGGEFLQHAELWGTASLEMLDQLIELTSGTDGSVMFQIVRAGVFVDRDALCKIFSGKISSAI